MFKREYSTKEKEIIKFMFMLTIFGFAAFLCNYHGVVRSYNTTMLALSYEYGFTSRALLGTLYHMLDAVLPVNMMDYQMVLRFAQIVTALFFLFQFAFSWLCLRRTRGENLRVCEYILLAFNFLSIATFSSGYNFFRVDLFMVVVCMTGALLLIYGKAEWLVIPLSALGVMFHQGYVFMFFNVALVLLIYKFLSGDRKSRWKYGTIFVLSFLLGSALFLWFEFFSRSNGYLYYDQIRQEAVALSENGYHLTLLQHEVLGIDLTDSEWELRKYNIVQTPFFLLICLPYLIMLIGFFVRLIRQAEGKTEKWKYLFLLIGSGTMLPDFILKCDFGRWFYAVLVYYTIILVALCAMRDRLAETELVRIGERLKSRPWAMLLLLVPILFGPFWDVDINIFMEHISTWLNANLLHWFNF